jgi:hypothetical protein
LDVATQLTASLRNARRPAPGEFFLSTIQSVSHIKEPSLEQDLFRLQAQLAEYRSALQVPQPDQGTTIPCTKGFKDETLFRGEGKNQVENLTIRDCPQLLDGISWKNVLFVNSRILYRGGPLMLNNVTFINCTFEVENNKAGADILQYAALDSKELTIGSIPNLHPTPN